MTSEPLNPVDLEAKIIELTNRITQGIVVVTQREQAHRAAEAAHRDAYARAFLMWDGPQTEKRYAADRDTRVERDALDVAEVAFHHAQRVARAAESELSAYQTLAKSVGAMYGATR